MLLLYRGSACVWWAVRPRASRGSAFCCGVGAAAGPAAPNCARQLLRELMMFSMNSHLPYPPGTVWTYRSRYADFERRGPLCLTYEITGATLSDDYTPDEASALDLWSRWYPQYAANGEAKIWWSVQDDGSTGLGSESAPFVDPDLDDFLTSYSWPEHAETGELLNWSRLPVRDRQWNKKQADKGGFIQELIGWKPSPFEPVFQAELIAKAAGLRRPAAD